MISRFHKVSFALVLMALLAAAPSSVFGQATPAEQVFVSMVNNQIVPVNCNNTKGSPLFSNGSNLQGLFVRDDLRIIACEHNQTGAVKMFDRQGGITLITSAISFPYAVAGDFIDGKRNLYVVTRTGGGADQLWRLDRNNSSYNPPTLIDTLVTSRLLADVKVIPPAPQQSTVDIVVLAQSPPTLLKYANADDCNNTCSGSVLIERTAFESRGLTPTAVAFANEKILVGTQQGTIMQFSSSGAFETNFATGLGNIVQLAAGVQDGQSRVFATVHSDRMICLGPTGNNIGTVTGLNPPTGVSLGSGGGTLLGAGANTVSSSGITTTVNVTQAGSLFNSCETFVDPRAGNAVDLHLCTPGGIPTPAGTTCAAQAGDATVNLGLPNIIPSYARGFLQSGTGPDRLIRVCQIGTSALFQGLVQDESDEESWLGFHPPCFEGMTPSIEPPQFFYTEEDLSLREGRYAINQTTVCNFDGADRWGFSVLIPSLNDTRPIDDPNKQASCNGNFAAADGIVEWQAVNLCGVLSDAACFSRSTQRSLQRTLDRALRDFNRGRYDSARLLIHQFQVDAQAADSNSCNTEELQGRAKAIKYQLCRALAGAGVNVGGTGPNSPCLTGAPLP